MSEQLSIVHIITRFIRGGADENTLISCNAFAERGHDVTLIFGREGSEAMTHAVHPGVHLIQLQSLQRSIHPFRDANALIGLRRILRSLNPDIIHTHTSKAGILGRAAAIGLRSPAIVHGIHILPFVNVGRSPRLLYLALERALAPFTDQYVSVSAGMRELALAHHMGHAGQHHVVPSGIRLENFMGARTPSRSAAPSAQRKEPLRVLYLANYEPRKKHRELITALAAAPRRFSDAVFLFAGHGHDRADLEELTRASGLDDQIKLLGFVDDPGSLIASADLCIYCSEREGLPRAIVQYCASGVPVVAFHLPGIEEVVRHNENGRLCAEGNFAALLDNVRQMLDDEALRKQMARAAANTDLDAWSANHVYDSLHRIYLEAMRRRRSL